jgi:hypothetical protein
VRKLHFLGRSHHLIISFPLDETESRTVASRASEHVAMQKAADPPSPPVTDTAVEGRLLCSFVPAIMLNVMEERGAAIQTPTTHNIKDAVALFAVR